MTGMTQTFRGKGGRGQAGFEGTLERDHAELLGKDAEGPQLDGTAAAVPSSSKFTTTQTASSSTPTVHTTGSVGNALAAASSKSTRSAVCSYPKDPDSTSALAIFASSSSSRSGFSSSAIAASVSRISATDMSAKRSIASTLILLPPQLHRHLGYQKLL